MDRKLAIVTGASRGIGEAIARKLTDDGFFVCMICRNSIDRTRKIACEIGGRAYQCDISDKTSVKTLIDEIYNEFSQIDLLVNNAGVSYSELFHCAQDDDLQMLYGTNLFGTLNMTRAVLPMMINAKYGNIINIASIWGEVGASCEVDYSVTKSAIIGLTKALSKEVGPCNIRVNCVSPGVIDTDMLSAFSSEDKDNLANDTPLSRLGKTCDVANAVSFLASETAAFITGEVLSVGGGFAK